MADTYSIPELVADLKRITAAAASEKEVLSQVRPLAARAALAKDGWLQKQHYQAGEEQGFGLHMLHEEADHSLAVFAIAWLAGRGAPPHNHGTWAVVAGVDGPEKNVFYERLDDGKRAGHAELKVVGEKLFAEGEVLAMPNGTLHSVRNESATTTVSLHIYGRHLNHTGRSQFDLERRTETPFTVRIES